MAQCEIHPNAKMKPLLTSEFCPECNKEDKSGGNPEGNPEELSVYLSRWANKIYYFNPDDDGYKVEFKALFEDCDG